MSFALTNYCEVFQNLGADVCWYWKKDAVFFVKSISMSLIVSVGLIGNFLLAFTILSSKTLRRKSVNIFIVNLSISNCLNLSLTAPVIVVDSITEFFELGEFICHAMGCVQVIFFVVPMLTLLAISVDRFLAIRKLMRDQNYSWKTFVVCLAIWAVGLGLGSTEYKYKTYSVTEFAEGFLDVKCYDNFFKGGQNGSSGIGWEFQRSYWFTMLAVVFVVPFTGLLLFYTRILVRIKQIEGQLTIHGKSRNRTMHNVTVMVMTVLVTTMVCWLPMSIYWIIKYLPVKPPRPELIPNPNVEKPFGSSEGFRYIAESCIFFHCAIQPIIYFLSGSNLRRKLSRWIPCMKTKRKPLPRVPNIEGADTYIERVVHRYSIDSKVDDVIYNWGGTTEEEVTSEEDAGSQTAERVFPKHTLKETQDGANKLTTKDSKYISQRKTGSLSLGIDQMDTPPNTPTPQRHIVISQDTNFLTLENLLLPAVLQRRLSRIIEK